MPTIIYIGGFALPDRNAAAQRVLNNARIFRALGYYVVLVGVSHDRPYDRTLHRADAGDADIDAWEIGYPASQRQWLDMISADWPLRQLADRGIVAPADVAAVICYNHPAVAQWRIARRARAWGARAIADCTEWYAPRAWTGPANIVKNLDVLARMHWVNRRMDGLITISPYLTDHYRSAALPTVEIPTLIERAEGPPPSLPTAPAPLPLFAIASGFGADMGADDIHDRIDWIIDLLDGVAQRGRRFILRIVGVDAARFTEVYPGLRPALDRLGDQVEFLGRQPRHTVVDLSQQAAFAFVLRKETRVTLAGFPTKYSEAVTFGTPVIINALPSVRAYHVEGRTGFTLDLNDRQAAVERLSKILATDKDALMGMKRYCRESGAFTAKAFERPVADFLSAVTGKETL